MRCSADVCKFAFINFIMEGMQREWRRFVEETKKSQEVVGELSKLYIIYHENVRETIRKCAVNLKYDPTPDCHRHLTTILDLLKRMHDPTDIYLNDVDPSILSKFEEQVYDLSQQVQKLLQTYNNSLGIDVTLLEGIKQSKDREEFGLKDEIKKSSQRILRSRSGRRKSHLDTAENTGLTTKLIEQLT
jgi:hypothetical protein